MTFAPGKFLSVTRRRAMKALVAIVAVPASWATEMLAPRPVNAFRAETTDDAMNALFDGETPVPSDKVRILAADLAENGAVVPIKIEADFDHIKSVSIVAVKNPVPLVAKFVFGQRVTPFVATRVKLAESGDVIAIVETTDGYFETRKFIEVTIGGCGV